jgi:hypothetical protein
MSIRRAIEAHVKLSTEAYKGTFPHTFVESLQKADRPLPGVIVMAGAADPALDNQPDSLSNWNVPVTILVMSSIDDTTVDQHSELVNTISNVMSLPSSRRQSKIQGLYIYNIAQSNIAHENQGRRMTAVMNFTATVNYKPITGWA